MEALAHNSRLLLMQNARQRYSEALDRRSPPEVVSYYRDLYAQAWEHYATAVIDDSSWGHHG